MQPDRVSLFGVLFSEVLIEPLKNSERSLSLLPIENFSEVKVKGFEENKNFPLMSTLQKFDLKPIQLCEGRMLFLNESSAFI